MTLNQTVSTVREVARLNLRLLRVNDLRADLLSMNNRLDSARKHSAETTADLQKAIAVQTFRISQLVEADPEGTEKQKRGEEMIAAYNKEIAEVAVQLAACEKDLNEEIAQCTKLIGDVEDGTFKVCKDSLQEESNRLLRGLGKQKVIDAVNAAENTQF